MPKPRLAAALRYRPSNRLAYAAAAALLAGTTAVASVTGTAIAATSGHAGYAASPVDPNPAAAPQGAATLTYGQDVSNYQPNHDWATSPAEFGIIKATEGTSFRDRAFARHWQELDKKGIVRGAYHYGHPRNNPIAEAEHFLSAVDSQPGKPGDLLVLDLETTDGRSVAEVNAWAKAWLSHVEKKTGVKPMFYSGWHFADTYGAGLAEYPLWVAHYSKPQGQVTPPADWKSWTIHQYSDSPIDQNVSALTPDQLRALGRPV
ncbi:glycoside hydrolase family 25 protein [Nonomuraea sp. NPDC048826]|uniref:glycoside hydrolase family 25 protein n=1 Tax=Nonomuraea sp. NPDC048826 TaxID=3364347 RepID=UPI00371C48D1